MARLTEAEKKVERRKLKQRVRNAMVRELRKQAKEQGIVKAEDETPARFRTRLLHMYKAGTLSEVNNNERT